MQATTRSGEGAPEEGSVAGGRWAAASAQEAKWADPDLGDAGAGEEDTAGRRHRRRREEDAAMREEGRWTEAGRRHRGGGGGRTGACGKEGT